MEKKKTNTRLVKTYPDDRDRFRDRNQEMLEKNTG